ncbi:MAG: phasin family protein [Gammaproteobacteria bacterium]|nr:phasin family protein [Gammaproteobacteria bacterium]
MQNPKEALEMINKLGTSGFDSLRELGELQMSTWNKLMNTQIEMFNSMMSRAEAQIKLASDAKDMESAVKAQVEINREVAEEMMKKTRESVEMAQETGEAYREWAEKAVKEVTEQVQAADKAA